MGYLAPGEIFKNMLQLKRFGLYFVKNTQLFHQIIIISLVNVNCQIKIGI